MEEFNEYEENSYVSEPDTEMIWSNQKTEKKASKDYQYIRRDPDSIKIKQKIPEERREFYEEDKTHVIVQVYETSITPGCRIRNAVTGLYYSNYRVGSLDENRLFKVIWATGHEGRKEPLFLFFSGPDEYEKHMLVSIPHEAKVEWRMRQIEQYRKDKRFKDADDDSIVKVIHNESRRVVIIK